MNKVSKVIEYLSKLDPEEEVVWQVWSKADVQYALEEVASNNEEGVSQEDLDRFDLDEFWGDFSTTLELGMENDISHWNQELYYQTLSTLKQEDARA